MRSRPSSIWSNSASPSVVSSTHCKFSHINKLYSPIHQLSTTFCCRVVTNQAGRSVKTPQPRHSCGFQHFPSCWTHLRWRLSNWLWGHYVDSLNLCCALIVSINACLFCFKLANTCIKNLDHSFDFNSYLTGQRSPVPVSGRPCGLR